MVVGSPFSRFRLRNRRCLRRGREEREQKPLAGAEFIERTEQRFGQGRRRNGWREPCSRAAGEEIGNASRGRRSGQGQAGRCCLKQRIRHSLMARGEHEESCAGIKMERRVDVACESHGGIQAEAVRVGFERGPLISIAGDQEVGARKPGAHGGEGLNQQIEAFFMRQPADGEQVRTRSGPQAGRLAGSANAGEVERVGQHRQLLRRDAELGAQIVGHGARLADGSSNGVDLERFSPGESDVRARMGMEADAPVIGFVGRLTRDKGIPELMEAFETVLAAEPRTRLLLVGWFDAAEDALDEDLRVRIQAHPRVHCTGMVDDAAPYYRAMDVLALPTWREGFPNAVLEAQASGVPVVTTLSTGSRDSVVPEVTGLLIPPGYPEAIAEAALKLLRNPARRKTMGGAARAWVREHYLEEYVLEMTVDFYRGLWPRPHRRAQSAELPTAHAYTA